MPKPILPKELWQHQGRVAPKSESRFGLTLTSTCSLCRQGTSWRPLPAGGLVPALHNFLMPAENAGSDKPAPFAFQPLTVLTATPPEETPSDNKQYQKLRLLQSVAGLDRGFAANTTAAALVESAALALAGTGEAVTLSWTPGELLMHQELKLPGVCWGGQELS